MKTLALQHGDLVIDGAGSYAMVSGAARIRQDLTLALLEEYGTDRFHPKFGSIIKEYLGNAISSDLQQLVKAEVNRVVQNGPGARSVVVLWNGRQPRTFGGHIDTSRPLLPAPDLATS